MTKAETPKKEKVVIQYSVDGNPITNPSVNALSGIAYFYTKGIKGADHPRIGVKELTALLAKAGVTDPKTTAFSVTLPNGKVLSATIGALAEKVARVKKADSPEAKAKKATDSARVAQGKKAITEATALKKWKDGGEKGERPDTSTLDAVTTLRETVPTKGAKKAAAVTKAVQANGGSLKPTKANGRTIKKAPVKKATAAAKAPAAVKATGGPKVFRGPLPKPSAAKKAAS